MAYEFYVVSVAYFQHFTFSTAQLIHSPHLFFAPADSRPPLSSSQLPSSDIRASKPTNFMDTSPPALLDSPYLRSLIVCLQLPR